MQDMQKMQVQSLGRENPVEEEMATLSSILAWKIPRLEDPGGLQFMGLERVGRDWKQHSTAWHGTYKLIGQNWGSGIPPNWVSMLSLPLTSSMILDS